MRDILELFDALDLMLGSGEGIVPPENLAATRDIVQTLRRRSTGAGTALVVALAGGTGTGKSSLLNAIAGEDVASVSRLRPHTERSLAWVPADLDPAVAQFIEELGVGERRTHTRLPGVAVIDLPGLDSTVDEHREHAEQVIANADVVVWVLDPEKYHDALLHDEFLAPLVRYADQTAFVLNKIDRLDEGAVSPVTDSVREALARSGYTDPVIFAVAARPAAGHPVGIGPLMAHLARELDVKRVALGKLLSDIAAAVRAVGLAADVWEGTGEGLAERWRATRDAALASLEPGVDGSAEDSLCRMEDFVAATASAVGGRVGDELRTSVGPEELETVLGSVQLAVAAGDLDAARAELDTRIGGPVSALLAGRSRLAALVALAHVGAYQLGHRYGAVVR